MQTRESEKLLACIDLWRTQTIDFHAGDDDQLEFSILIGDQSYLLQADDPNDAARWVRGLQARQHRPEGTPSEAFSLRSEHMDAESDASSSDYNGRRPRAASSDNGSVSGSRRSSLSVSSYVETQMLHGFALPKPVKGGLTAPIDSGLLTNVADNGIVAK